MIEGLLQPQHLLIILAVALFVFGPKKLPELGKGLGQGIKSFREGIKQATAEPVAPARAAEAEKPHA
jgi:sec-independent protein translocase protein TatA